MSSQFEIERIREILEEINEARKKSGVNPRDMRLLDAILGDPVTKEARSHDEVFQDKIIEVGRKSEKIRDWVLRNGEEYVDGQFVNKRFSDENWEVSSNIESDETNIYYLSISRKVKAMKTVASFMLHFDKTYGILIEYEDPDRPGKRKGQYEVNHEPLNKMVQNDAQIATLLLNGFIGYKGID